MKPLLVSFGVFFGLCAFEALPAELFLSDSSGVGLDDADRKLQSEAVLGVLEAADARASKEWSNPKSGASGQIDGLGNLHSHEGLHCRGLRLSTHAKGIDSKVSFPVCKGEDGEWFIASGMKLYKDDSAAP